MLNTSLTVGLGEEGIEYLEYSDSWSGDNVSATWWRQGN